MRMTAACNYINLTHFQLIFQLQLLYQDTQELQLRLKLVIVLNKFNSFFLQIIKLYIKVRIT